MSVELSFANNFWGKDDTGYHRVFQRMHHAKQTCEELQAFYKERTSIEQDYARRLNALSKKALGSNETGALKTSFDTMRTMTEAMGRSHDLTAKQLSDQLAGPLATFAQGLRERRKTVEDTMGRLTKAKTQQNATAEKARARYESECHKISGFQAQQNLLMGNDLERNNHKLDKARFAVEGLQRQYQDTLRVLAQSMEAWNAEWRVSCDRLQQLEEERLTFLKSNMWAYANAVSTVCVSDDEGCESVRVSLEKCEASKDIELFVREFGTGSRIQDPPEFTNFLGGFSRDDTEGHYQMASYTAQTDEEESRNTRPESRPTLQGPVPQLAPDSPNSLYDSNSSPTATSLSSAHTSPQMGSSSPKRRSWAMPFKRQSSPDLSQYRPPQSMSSFDFGDSRDRAHVDSAPAQVSSQAHSTASSQPNQHQQKYIPAGGKDDPLLAAMERLKPSTGARPRPMSMPPQMVPQLGPQQQFQPSQQPMTGSPYGNGHVTSYGTRAADVPRSRSPTRKQVSDQRTQSVPRSKSANDVWSPQGQHLQQQQQQQQRLPTRTSNGIPVIRHSRAQYDYRAAIPEEVSFRKGDILLVTATQEDGWWDSEVWGKRQFGLAPSNFLADIR